MTSIRAVVLDFDGLILETENACYGGWRALFREHGADYALEEYQRILGTEGDPRQLFETRCGGTPDWTALERRRRVVEDELNAALAVQPGVVELLDQATARGLRIGIASSSPHRWVDRHLKNHGLFERFHAIVCRDDVTRAKPAPDLYHEAIRRLGVEAREAISFEDSHHGSTAAIQAGLWCVAVPTAMTANQDFSHAHVVRPTLAGLDLTELIAGLVARPHHGTAIGRHPA